MCIPFLCQNSTLIVNLTFDNIRLLIEERITMLSKMFLLFRSCFLSRTKKSRGTDIFGLCFVNTTQRVLCCWKNYISMLNLRMFTLFMAEKYACAWFNLISCHSVQKEIKKKVKKCSQRLSCCVNCLVASGLKAAGLRQFSKVRSLKRDFVDRCKFHCCCTFVTAMYVIVQKFEFYANCRTRKSESVFIKTLRPSWSYSSIGPATF